MGLFNFLKSKTYAPAMIADNAIKKYHTYGKLVENPTEIAQRLWDIRYYKARLDTKMEIRLSHYVQTEFPIETILDFCLGNLDIEFLVGPPELDTYENASNYIGKELAKNGVPWTEDDYPAFCK